MKSRAGSRHGLPRRRVLHPLSLTLAAAPSVPSAASGRPDDAPPAPQVTYDPDADTAYVHIAGPIPAGAVGRTISATASIDLDFDREGRLVGIELRGRRLMHPRLLAR